MATRESNLWQWLARARLTFREDLKLDRIENSAGAGMPDVFGLLRSMNGGWPEASAFWIELKVAVAPARIDSPVRIALRPAQVAWLTIYSRLGGRCGIAVQIAAGLRRRVFLVQGCYAQRLYDGVSMAELEGLALFIAESGREGANAAGLIRAAATRL